MKNNRALMLSKSKPAYAAMIIGKDLDAIRKSSIKDGLVKDVYNRGHFDISLEKEIARANRYGNPLSLIMLDVDHFKEYNDNYGHVEGDRVLREIGSILNSTPRESDDSFRYGGEEFAIILPETKLKDVANVSDRIRQEIESKIFSPEGKAVTASFGVAQYEKGWTSKKFVKEADKQLYLSKNNGRNRIYFDNEPIELK